MKAVYIMGSLRNAQIPVIGQQIRDLRFDVFDDWFAAGPEADDHWQKYETSRGHRYDQALKNYPAQHTFALDKKHLDRCDIGVLVLPAGKSGHLELGYAIGKGKLGYILFDGGPEPERFDVMYNFATGVFFSREDLFKELRSKI